MDRGGGHLPAGSATATPRVAVIGCFHETNTFAGTPTDIEAFRRRRGWLVGPELAEAYSGTRTVVGGMLAAAEQLGFEPVPVFGAYATPAGAVTRAAFDRVTEQVIDGLQRAGALDGLLVELHGAMVVEDEHDPETRLLERIRRVVGDLPVVAVTDLHANMTPARVRHLDALVGYRTNPHVDTYEAGVRAAEHLQPLIAGGHPTVVVHRAVPVLAAPIAQRTDTEPLRGLLQTAHDLEHGHGLVEVAVHAGFAHADVAHAGLSFTVTAPADRRDRADEALARLCTQAWEHRHEFAVTLPDTDDAVRQTATRVEQAGGPVVITDTGDNINGGGPGDSTWLLRAAIELLNAPIAATLWDPAAVTAAREAGVGGRFEASLGGKAEVLSGAPLVGEATVRWLGDGDFVNRGPMASGARVSMGPTAVVGLGPADVILQSLPVQPNDPEMFRSVGLRPAGYAVILLKGAAAVRAGWGPLANAFVDAATPGVTDCDLRRLPYRARRGAWPLDPDLSFHGATRLEES
ncbi:MAG: M81 family metallopeptidase [Actinobacteria bacterium]|nr:M81 family metallopeptidase [Actinomycetota bacterium]